MSGVGNFIQLRVFGPWHIRRTVCYGDWTLCGRQFLDRDEKSQSGSGLTLCKRCEQLAEGAQR
jgi:hypothetical protein